jgi:hypothetical protein
MSINIEDLKNGTLKKKFDSRRTMRIINGKRYDRNAQKDSLALATATQHLTNAQLGTETETGTSNFDNSKNLIEAIGCSVLDAQKYQDYSIVEEQQTTNPNILDDLSKKKNSRISATNKFPNASDPFYELDEEPPRRIELENKTGDSIPVQQGYIKLAENIAVLNIETGNKLKYFK